MGNQYAANRTITCSYQEFGPRNKEPDAISAKPLVYYFQTLCSSITYLKSHLMLPIDYYLFVLSIFDTLVRSIFQNSTAFKFDSNLRTPGTKKSRKMSLASLPATVQDAESKVELLGAIKNVAIDISRFLGVLTLAARDNITFTSFFF